MSHDVIQTCVIVTNRAAIFSVKIDVANLTAIV